ncbi:MAG: class I SAM-dependent methyltransferase [Chlamydiota bacterium]
MHIAALLLASLLTMQSQFSLELPPSDHPFGVLASHECLDALSEGLEMPPFSESGLVPTKNYGGGFMLVHLDPVSREFIDFCKQCTHPVLEIGSAYGVATLPALKNSTCPVVVDDIGVENLLILRQQVETEDRERLFLNAKSFPDALDFPPQSFEAVLICRVFHFMRGEAIEEGLRKILEWLVPGGKLFVVTASPYQGNLKEFVPLYEERWTSGNSWPGYVEDYGPNAPGLSHNLNPFLHVMDDRPLCRALEAAGFEVEQVQFIDRRKTIPTLCLDGREAMGVVAVKK